MRLVNMFMTGQLISIDNHGSYNFEYDAFGQMSKKTMANGTYTVYTSDHLGRLKSLMNYKDNNAATAPGSVISQYNSGDGDFDLVGNRKKVSKLDGNYEYKYDSVYQLTQSYVDSSLVEDYSYDSVGNRLVGAPITSEHSISGNYVYDNNNRLISITDSTASQTYTYDNNGSRITKTDSTGVTNYTYDYESRLKRIDFTDSTYAEYKYDALGRRIEKNVNGVKTRYCYDGEDIVAVLDGNNNAVASITHGPGIDHPLSISQLAGEPVSRIKTYYYHQDYLGSITSITDSAQNVVASAKYDAFGNIISSTGLLTYTLVYAYTGREYDPESGLYFYRARYYDSKVGRFLEADPIGFMGGVNFYAYVGNNPVNFVDPWGLWTFQIGLSGSGGLAAGGTGGGGIIFGYSNQKGFQFGTYKTAGAGGYAGAGGSGTLTVAYSNNKDINNIGGFAANGGASGGEGLTFGGDININKDGDPSYSFSAGFGGGLPFETHGMGEWTWINEWTKNKKCK